MDEINQTPLEAPSKRPRPKKPRQHSGKPSKPPKRPILKQAAPYREIAKLVTLYLTTVRMQDRSDYRGIFQQMNGLLVKHSLTLVEIEAAIRHYAADPFVKSNPQPKRTCIRSFMKPEKVRQWAAASMNPAPARTNGLQFQPAIDPAIARLDQQAEQLTHAPKVQAPIWDEPTPDEDNDEQDLAWPSL